MSLQCSVRNKEGAIFLFVGLSSYEALLQHHTIMDSRGENGQTPGVGKLKRNPTWWAARGSVCSSQNGRKRCFLLSVVTKKQYTIVNHHFNTKRSYYTSSKGFQQAQHAGCALNATCTALPPFSFSLSVTGSFRHLGRKLKDAMTGLTNSNKSIPNILVHALNSVRQTGVLLCALKVIS